MQKKHGSFNHSSEHQKAKKSTKTWSTKVFWVPAKPAAVSWDNISYIGPGAVKDLRLPQLICGDVQLQQLEDLAGDSQWIGGDILTGNHGFSQ